MYKPHRNVWRNSRIILLTFQPGPYLREKSFCCREGIYAHCLNKQVSEPVPHRGYFTWVAISTGNCRINSQETGNISGGGETRFQSMFGNSRNYFGRIECKVPIH